MILFTIMIFIYNDVMGMEKKKTEENGETKEKKTVGCPPHPMWRPTIFWCPQNTENKQDLP